MKKKIGTFLIIAVILIAPLCCAYGQQMVIRPNGGGDVVTPNLTTSLSDYNAASDNEGIEVTLAEYDLIKAALSNSTESGTYNTSVSFSTTESHSDELASVGGGDYYPLLFSFDIKQSAATTAQVIIRDGTITGAYDVIAGAFNVPAVKSRVYILIKNPALRNGNGFFGFTGIGGNVQAPVESSIGNDRAFNIGAPATDLGFVASDESLSFKSVTTTTKQW